MVIWGRRRMSSAFSSSRNDQHDRHIQPDLGTGRNFRYTGAAPPTKLERQRPHACNFDEPTTMRSQVSRSYSSRPPLSGSRLGFRRLRRRSAGFLVEFLETRQLLSVAGTSLSQIVADPSVYATPLVYNSSPSGLSPSQVRQAYGLNNVSFDGGAIAGDGSGQTIAIISAYDAPTIGSDLRQFDSQFGLPNPPSFLKYYQPGVTQANSGWCARIGTGHRVGPRDGCRGEPGAGGGQDGQLLRPRERGQLRGESEWRCRRLDELGIGGILRRERV